jgi:hypothetical protein
MIPTFPPTAKIFFQPHALQVPTVITAQDVKSLQRYVDKRVTGQIVSRFEINSSKEKENGEGGSKWFSARNCYVKIVELTATQLQLIDPEKAFALGQGDGRVTRPIVGKKQIGGKVALVLLYDDKPKTLYNTRYERLVEEYFMFDK